MLELLQQLFGDRVEVTFEVILPDRQRELLARYLHEVGACGESKAVPASRVECGIQLLSLQLSQQEVAELMHISRGLLAVALNRAQGSTRPASMRGMGQRRSGHAPLR